MNNNTDAQTVARFEVVGDKQKYTAARTLLYGNRLDTKIMCFVKIRIVRHRKKNSITLKLLYVRKKSEFGANDTAAVVLNAREPICLVLFISKTKIMYNNTKAKASNKNSIII